MDNPKPLILAVYELQELYGYVANREAWHITTINKNLAIEFHSASDAVAFKNKIILFYHRFLGKTFSIKVETK